MVKLKFNTTPILIATDLTDFHKLPGEILNNKSALLNLW